MTDSQDDRHDADRPGNPPTPRERRAFAVRVATAVAIALAMIAVAQFLRSSVYVLLLAFAAVLIGVILRGMAAWLARRTRMPVGVALALVVLALLGSLVLLGAMVAPAVVQQFEQLADQLPQSIRSAEQRLREYSWGRRLLGDQDEPGQQPGGPGSGASSPQQQPQEPEPGQAGQEQGQAGQGQAGQEQGQAGKGQDQAGQEQGRATGGGGGDPASTQPAVGGAPTLVGQAIDMTTSPQTLGRVTHYARLLVEAAFTLLLVVIVGIYLAAQPRFYVDGTLMLFPKAERPRLREVMLRVGFTLRWWMVAQLVPMLAIGVLVGGGLWLIGVPLWLPLGILAALLNFIPNFGPIIAAVPAILIALADDPRKALWVVGLMVLAQNLEGYLITPLVQRRAVELPPALTILSQVLLGLLLGPLGIILAAPLTAAALVAIKMLYVEDALRTPTETPGDAPRPGQPEDVVPRTG